MMKLDTATVQFERQLKQAKRLSLLEYAAKERRNRQHLAVCHAASFVVGTRRNKPVTLRKLQQKTVGNFVSQNYSSLCNTVNCRSSSVFQYQFPIVDSCTCIKSGGLGRVSGLNIEENFHVVSSANDEDSDSSFDELPIVDNSVEKKLPQPSFRIVSDFDIHPHDIYLSSSYYRFIEKTSEELNEEVEYDVDEEDLAWLHLLNEYRCCRKPHGCTLSVEAFELVMDRLEKEAHNMGQCIVMGSTAPVTSSSDDDALCAVCGDDECTNTNAILFCDSCNLAVHQECYGIPFVPEGQWLCRQCQAGVGDNVTCCLCPVRGGAVKQTNDGRWAHVICALWIPEVGFGSVELLEPITKLHQVPRARQHLTCTVCGKSRVGACIQCMHKHCYKAFHITCAQQIGLYMKIEPLLDAYGVMINVTKTLLCNNHKPQGVPPFQPMIDNCIDNDGRPPAPTRERTKSLSSGTRAHHFRNKVGNHSNLVPSATCEIPVIPSTRLRHVAGYIQARDKYQLLQTIHSYWLLKRRSRNGLPLLRRLQISLPDYSGSTSQLKNGNQYPSTVMNFGCVRKLRQEMEKVRLLLELVRKRERLKKQMMNIHEMVIQLKLQLPVHSHNSFGMPQVEVTDDIVKSLDKESRAWSSVAVQANQAAEHGETNCKMFEVNRKRHFVNITLNAVNHDNGPPKLSRCPSPNFASSSSISTCECDDPPALMPSESTATDLVENKNLVTSTQHGILSTVHLSSFTMHFDSATLDR